MEVFEFFLKLALKCVSASQVRKDVVSVRNWNSNVKLYLLVAQKEFSSSSEGVLVFFSGGLDCGWPDDVEQEGHEHAGGAVDLMLVGVAETSEPASCISVTSDRSAILFPVDVGNESVLALRYELEEENEEDGEPFPGVEVHEHEVQAEADSEVVDVEDVWIPGVAVIIVAPVISVACGAPFPHLRDGRHFCLFLKFK